MRTRRDDDPVTAAAAIAAREPGRAPTRWSVRQIAVSVRLAILALVLILIPLTHHHLHTFLWFLVVAAAAGAASVRAWGPTLAPIVAAVESVVTVVAVLEAHDATSPLFPYLLAPAFAAGLVSGLYGAVVPAGLAGLALVVAGEVGAPRGDNYAAAAAQWVVLAVATGVAAWWIGRLIAPREPEPEQLDPSYAAAYRLLAQLRPVARQLAVGLDPVTIAEGLLQSLRDVYDFERGVVLVRTGGSRLAPLATLGGSRDQWDVEVTGEGPFAEAWLSQRPQRLNRQFSGDDGSGVVLPLVIGLRSFGLIGLETSARGLAAQDAGRATRVVEEAALRLETALLFDEVRGVATAEERRRLAREIHDGIAQELSYLGYVVDGLAADAQKIDEPLTEQLRQLRREITRIISELRMSIFDLRSDVDSHGGLGAALSEYVRSVGQQSGFTVHMSLSEAGTRLPAETEAELLRIGQEAITNARKHAQAENLWVTLSVDPPRALLRVEDDGRGLGQARDDSYGLSIMRERASRLRTSVHVGQRAGGGTVVEVALGGYDASGTNVPSAEAPPRTGHGGREELSTR